MEGLRARVEHDGSVHDHPVGVIAGRLRLAGVRPNAVGAFHHIERNIHNGDLHLLRVGSGEVKGHAVVRFDARILDAGEVIRGRVRRQSGDAGRSHGRIDHLLPRGGLRVLSGLRETAEDSNSGE
jgi:hypothetical protein